MTSTMSVAHLLTICQNYDQEHKSSDMSSVEVGIPPP
jgi:hypothetical protein